jgi:hypothetical protein
MASPKVYADFQNLDDCNQLRLTCTGTREDLARQGIDLQEGLVLTLTMDDADDQGRPDELRAEGVVHFNADQGCWVAAIDWSAIRHASQESVADAKGSHRSDLQPSPHDRPRTRGSDGE